MSGCAPHGVPQGLPLYQQPAKNTKSSLMQCATTRDWGRRDNDESGSLIQSRVWTTRLVGNKPAARCGVIHLRIRGLTHSAVPCSCRMEDSLLGSSDAEKGTMDNQLDISSQPDTAPKRANAILGCLNENLSSRSTVGTILRIPQPL